MFKTHFTRQAGDMKTALRRAVAYCRVGLLCIALSLGASAHAQDEKRKIIIDDEGFSLMHMMLIESDDVEVLGISTVSGNVWVNRSVALALRGLEMMDRTEIPVVKGALYPLLNSEKRTELWESLYGKLTWKGAWMKEWVEPTVQSTPPYFGPNDPVELEWGQPKTKPLDIAAANFMIQMVHKYPGEVTIVEGGPMTNLALAQALDPEFASLAKELVYMGGSFNPHQVLDNQSAAEFAREFENTPRREFNIRWDPEAASMVSRAPWKKITVVPVDPSTSTQLSEELLDRIASVSNSNIREYLTKQEAGFPLWDEIAAGVFLDPSIVTEKAELYVDYNAMFGPGYGDTLSWSEHYQPGLGERKATVIKAIDPAKLEALMISLMTREPGED